MDRHRHSSRADRASHAPSGRQLSVADATFAFWLPVIPLLCHRRLLNADGDLIRHIVTGNHILQAGPRFADPFSFSRAGEPFLAYEWLSQLTLAWVHCTIGLPGIAALSGLLIAASLALVVAYVRTSRGDPLLALMTGGSAAILTAPHWIARPHLFTFLCTAVLLHLLERRRILPPIALLFVLWANLHPGFLYGVVMISVWSCGSALDDIVAKGGSRRILTKRAAPVAVAIGASLLNPFGWSLHAHAIAWARADVVRAIYEFQPLEPSSLYGVVFLAVVGSVVVGLAASREWVGWTTLLILGIGVAGALSMRRNVPLFALFALPFVTRRLAPVFRALPSWVMGRMRAEFDRSEGPGWRIGLGSAVLLSTLLVVDAASPRVTLVPTEFSGEKFPAAAVRHARERGVTGRLFSHWSWGGYVLAHWPGQRIFVDSMADFFGEALVREYQVLNDALPGWNRKLVERDFSIVLLRPDSPLVRELRTEPDWQIAYEDHVAVLLTRSSPAPATGAGCPVAGSPADLP